MNRLNKFRGIFPPIATPFNIDAAKSINYDKLTANLNKWKAAGIPGYVVLGTNGETPLLSKDEKMNLVKYVADYCKQYQPQATVIAGTGVEGTLETIELCNEFATYGIDAALVITPSFFKGSMNELALETHYRTVADQSKLPVLLYSVSAITGIDLSADVAIRLASHHNIIGMKDSGGDITKIARIIAETKNDEFMFLAGSAGFLLPSLQAGAYGGVCAIGNCLPQPLVKLYKSFTDNGWSPELQALQASLIKPNSIVTRGLGVPALKYAMDKLGYYGGPVRAPVLDLTDTQKKAVDAVFDNLNI